MMKILKVFLLIAFVAIVQGAVVKNSDSEIILKEDLTTSTLKPTREPYYGAAPPNTTVCYDFVGCFNNNMPFNNTGYFLPIDPLVIGTIFKLYNRKTTQGQVLSYRDQNVIKNSNYDPSLPLKVVVHGFQNNIDTEWLNEFKDVFLEHENVNTILVGWGNGAEFPHYNNASSNTRVVGKELSLIVAGIRKIFYASNPSKMNIHCIGHSLGAHICGYAGSASEYLFDRISGLDPAGPFFEDTDPNVRLDPSDAKFVDAYHTNGGTLFSASFGIIMPVGNVDFYVNGGSSQPGCPGLTSIIGGIFNGQMDPTKEVGCSHNRAIPYYIESIKSSCSFVAFRCESKTAFESGECRSCNNYGCAVMGYYTNVVRSRGNMYLATKAESPYCGHNYYFLMDVNPNSVKTAGEILLNIDPDSNGPSVQITGSDTDIKAGTSISKIFVVDKEIQSSLNADLVFNKKPKSFFQWNDPNASKFGFDRIRIIDLELDEIYAKCQNNQQLEDKKPLRVDVGLNNC